MKGELFVKASEVMRAWGSILSGRSPSLSVEITRECPLRCPGCYAYGDTHLGQDAPNLRKLSDFKGDELVERVLRLVEAEKPLHLSIVGGDPLVRYREVDRLLPILAGRGVHVQLVTSAFRTIPIEWQDIPRLNVVVSIDGLQPEHDARRMPATYDRILKNIHGLDKFISVHCTITSKMLQRSGYLEEFTEFWSARPEAKRIWFSLFTPQIGEVSEEIIPRDLRPFAVEQLLALYERYPMIDMYPGAIRNFATPPASPSECTFARTTTTISADFKTRVTPCQFGGEPDCSQCGCVASVGLHAVAKYRLFGVIPLRTLFNASIKIGEIVRPSEPASAEVVAFPIIQGKRDRAEKSNRKTAAAD